jgi:hypothetical protein
MRSLAYALMVSFLAALAFSPLGIEAQQARATAHIGYLSPSSLADPRTRTFVELFAEECTSWVGLRVRT